MGMGRLRLKVQPRIDDRLCATEVPFGGDERLVGIYFMGQST